MSVVIVKLIGSVNTTSRGYHKLITFYEECLMYSDLTIHICIENLNWLDANMTAIFQGLVKKLEISNRLKFKTDLSVAKIDCNVLVSNGFIVTENFIATNRGTTVSLREFCKEDSDIFVEYVMNDLLSHKGLVLNDVYKNMIISSMIEIFANYEIHSKSDMPMFVCGQYYPKIRTLRFTVFDLGVGFFKAINEKEPNITCSCDAISWAFEDGTSTKIDEPGGGALFELKNEVISNGDKIEVISGDSYKTFSNMYDVTDGMSSILRCKNIGTAINLHFNIF